MNLNSKYKIFANNILVAGPTRSLVVDTLRGNLQLIPNSLYALVKKYDGKLSIKDILNKYDESNRETLIDYFKFLLTKEIIFLADEPALFPEMDTSWDYPAHITNSIIEFNPELLELYKPLIAELNDLLCNFIEVRLFQEFSKKELIDFLQLFESSTILSINLIINYKTSLTKSDFEALKETFPRLLNISVYNSTIIEEPKEAEEKDQPISTIKFFAHEVGNHSCGMISKAYFVPNIQAVTEALKYNSCLNRKVSIDAQGNIKNCPSLAPDYGNIRDDKVAEVVTQPAFRKFWNVNKDQVQVCRDCEFRYVCTDCRAFVEDPTDDFSKPLKCGYDPYTGQWSEWSENPLKQKAIESYGLQKITMTNSST